MTGKQSKGLDISLPSQDSPELQDQFCNCPALCDLVKLTTTLVTTVFYLDNKKVWIALRPKTIHRLIKKK